ncbi:hypothetical protein ACSV9I_06455 [Rhizobium sp. G187]|uniref:hypothetical protein n=1 Tax=Rhizobium sp. G187 TaxID=3451352 RepID=UPI003EE6980C
MLRLFCVALTLLVSSVSVQAGAGQSDAAPYVLINDSNDAITEQAGKPNKPHVRPQRYICVVDQSGNIGGGGQVSCPAKPARVGGRCRCANVTGSGTLYTY